MLIEANFKIDDLNAESYRYWIRENMDVVLDSKIVLRRETPRHKLKVVVEESYSRLHLRQFGVKEEPKVSLEVQLEVVRIAKSKIQIKRWEDSK